MSCSDERPPARTAIRSRFTGLRWARSRRARELADGDRDLGSGRCLRAAGRILRLDDAVLIRIVHGLRDDLDLEA